MIWHATTLFLGFLLGVFVAALLSAGAQGDPVDPDALAGALLERGPLRVSGSRGATVAKDRSRVTLSGTAVEQLDLGTEEVTQNQRPTANSGGYSPARSSQAVALGRAGPRFDA